MMSIARKHIFGLALCVSALFVSGAQAQYNVSLGKHPYVIGRLDGGVGTFAVRTDKCNANPVYIAPETWDATVTVNAYLATIHNSGTRTVCDRRIRAIRPNGHTLVLRAAGSVALPSVGSLSYLQVGPSNHAVWMVGHAGRDVLKTQNALTLLNGGAGNDYLEASSSNNPDNYMIGGDGDDCLSDGDGRFALLDGGAGFDGILRPILDPDMRNVEDFLEVADIDQVTGCPAAYGTLVSGP